MPKRKAKKDLKRTEKEKKVKGIQREEIKEDFVDEEGFQGTSQYQMLASHDAFQTPGACCKFRNTINVRSRCEMGLSWTRGYYESCGFRALTYDYGYLADQTI